MRHVDASPVSRSVVRPRSSIGRGYSGSGGAVAVTSYAHFDGVSALPDGPPHCVRFHVDAEGRCGVMSRAEAAVNKIAIITTDDSHLLKFGLHTLSSSAS